MKKLSPYLLLSILPVLFIIICIIYKNSIGEYYLSIGAYDVPNYDPAYVYLISSLNLSQLSGFGIGHFDHPGTPAQIIGAVIIKFLYCFSTNQSADIVKDVFDRPEYYLIRINLVFVLMNSFALFILGIVSFKRFNNIFEAVFLQLTPFGFSTIYFKLTDVSAEPLLIFAILILLSVTFLFVYDKSPSKEKTLKYVIISGLVCGFALSSKIVFAPLMIIPLLLIKRSSYRILFLSVAFFCFSGILFTVIAFDSLPDFTNWLSALITHSGKYGTGEQDFIDSTGMMSNFEKIFYNNPVFAFTYFLIIFVLIFSFIKKYKLKIRSGIYFKLLTGIFLAMSFQILIVLKHFGMHYLIPALLLSIPGIFVIYKIITELLPEKSFNMKAGKIILPMFLTIFIIYNLSILKSEMSNFASIKTESHKIVNYLNSNLKKSLIVSAYGASDQAFPLFLGAGYATSRIKDYNSMLSDEFHNEIVFNRWLNRFDYINDLLLVKNKLLASEKVVFVCDAESVLHDFLENINEITGFSTDYNTLLVNLRGEGVYEIMLKK